MNATDVQIDLHAQYCQSAEFWTSKARDENARTREQLDAFDSVAAWRVFKQFRILHAMQSKAGEYLDRADDMLAHARNIEAEWVNE